MSIGLPINRDTRRRDLVAANAQTVFTLDCPVFDLADVAVFKRFPPAGDFVQVLAGFTLAFVAGQPGSARATFAVAPKPTGGDPAVTIRIEAKRTQERVTNATRAGVAQSVALEADLDRVSTVLQEVRRDVDDVVAQALYTRESGTVDAHAGRITNAADAVAATDLVTLQQLTVAIATGVVGPAGALTHRQIVLALTDAANPSGLNVYPAVLNGIDPLAGDAASAEWAARSPVVAGDVLAVLIQAQTGWNGTQMTAFLTLARSKAA